MKREEDWLTVSDGLVPGHEDVGVVALLGPRGALSVPPLAWQSVTLLADGMWTSTLLLPATKSDRREWQRFHRFVGLSGLGWTFVLAAVLWEFFALAFSERAGWGWDKGAFFFAWGLGILAFGFYLRTSRKRPAVSHLFLGVNVLVLSVLSLIVATG